MRIGQRLRILRGEQEIGVAELAEKAGVSRQYIYALEAGERKNVSLAIATRLASALGIGVDEFGGETTDDGAAA